MGMSASQMRFCMISGEKSDVEYQGQQVNQQRTTLATKSSAYNNQLLNLKVPTPPSSNDYTKTSYTFVQNGETLSVVGTQFKTSAYTVNGKTYDAGTYIVNCTTSTTTTKGKGSGSSLFTSSTDAATGKVTYFRTGSSGSTTMEKVSTDPSTDEGKANLSKLNRICEDCQILDANGRKFGDTGYVMPTFYSYTNGGVTKYALESDLQANADTTNRVQTYYVDDNASVTESSDMPGCTVNWSETNRMTSITVPDADGDGRDKTYQLSVSTVNDKTAYEDAYNEYEYQKEVYDQNVEKINAQVEIIQSQDKKLELKLQNLDTQQKALSTEMDSVKKVIDKNIEASFKAFA